jgi:L-2,4-diaminobutyrate decarboxylase
MITDDAFTANAAALRRALDVVLDRPPAGEPRDLRGRLPERLPESGLGESASLRHLADIVVAGARRLGGPLQFAHMDPPTPWVTWAATLWNASLNQNLLHPATAPVARDIEARVMAWLAPLYGMDGGHMTSGSTAANLTALWAARERHDIAGIVASDAAHVSIAKAARILRIPLRKIPSDRRGRLIEAGAGDLRRSCLVLTAGHTSTGAIDPLALAGRAAWTHVDAAWAGPLALSAKHGHLLAGIDRADSIAMSGHKLFFQPKDSGLVLFRDSAAAHAAISFDGPYLAAPTIGIHGSRGANAVPLMAMLLAWGGQGLADRLDRCMATAETVAAWIEAQPDLELLAPPETGIIVWRPAPAGGRDTAARLPAGLASATVIEGETWLRCVSANPNAAPDAITRAIHRVTRM